MGQLLDTMIPNFKYAVGLLCCALLAAACGGNDAAKKDDKALAQVYDKTLYLSELQGVVPEQSTPEDSALIISAYIQRWAYDQLLMNEAERNIPKDLNIDELVRDYRASLIRFNFEEQLIGEQLDSTVSEEESRRFYEDNKDQFQLENTIVKAVVVKLRGNAPQSEMNKLWYSRSANDQAKLREFAQQWGVLALLDQEKWYKLEEIAAILPKGTLSSDNVGSRKEGVLSDDDFRYYFRLLESVSGKTTAPFEYAQPLAQKIILHKRKQDLLQKWKAELYQKELRRENVKILQ